MPQSRSQRPTALLLRTPHLRWTGLTATLRQHARVRLVGETTCPDEAIAHAAATRPDLIVLDADGSPAPLGARARRLHTASRLVVLGDDPQLDPVTLRTLHAAGLAAYVLWAALDADPLLLARCLPVVLETPIRLLPGALLDALTMPERRQHPRTACPRRALTDRERLVLRRLLQGWSRGEIAQRDTLSRSKVDRLVVRLHALFGVTSPCALGVQATLLGFADALELDDHHADPTAHTAHIPTLHAAATAHQTARGALGTASQRVDDCHQRAADRPHAAAEYPHKAAEKRNMS